MKGSRGFTLIELSIVLVIIALFSGMIVAAKHMIRASQVNSIVTDQARYMQAIASFRDKYQEYPGDMSRAESVWGTDPGGCNPLTYVTSYALIPKKETCNGNGDARIASYDFDNNDTGTAPESERAWQQLADAEFIEGTYSGFTPPTGSPVGISNPVTALPNTSFTIFYINNGNLAAAQHDSTYYPDAQTQMLGLFKYGAAGVSPALTVQEAYALDTKMDDGFPQSGIVASRPASITPNCVSGATIPLYLASTSSDTVCFLNFKIDASRQKTF
jgi:prepilin-type N-terminal cleavage/methylation domain-containing protein